MANLSRAFLKTPIGILQIEGDKSNLYSVKFPNAPTIQKITTKNTVLRDTIEQLTSYFHGKLFSFTIPFNMRGTEFQRLVWQEALQIPYGRTVSYKWLAAKINRPHAYRAVGQAMHRNPLPIIMPCHRVISTTGSLTGYASGLKRKQFLLNLEKQTINLGMPNLQPTVFVP